MLNARKAPFHPSANNTVQRSNTNTLSTLAHISRPSMNSLFITRKSQGIKIMKKVGESQSHKRTNKAIGDTATSVKKSKHSEKNEVEKFIKKNNDLEFR